MKSKPPHSPSVTPKPTKNSVKVVNFKLPPRKAAELVEQKGRKTLDQIWHLIVGFVMDYPEKEESSDIKLWEHFRPLLKSDMSYDSFKQGLSVRRLADIRAVNSKRKRNKTDKEETQGSRKQSIALSQSIAESFDQKRKRNAIMHLDRMGVIVDRATTLLEKDSQDLSKNPEKGIVFLDSHLDKATKLHRLAASVYNIDSESKEDLAKRQLAIITNFDPFANLSPGVNPNPNTERSVNGKVIDESNDS